MATHESKERRHRAVTLSAPKTGMTGNGCGRRTSQWKGSNGEGSLANKGTNLRGMDNNFLFLWVCVCVLQVTLAYESIVPYMCGGKVLMDILV